MELKEAYTYFIVPFELQKEVKEVFASLESGIWEAANMKNLESNILYPYIQSFLQGMVREETPRGISGKHNEHYYRIFSLKTVDEKQETSGINASLREKLLQWQQFTQMDFCVQDKYQSVNIGGKPQPKDIHFNILNSGDDFDVPRLIVSPLSRDGLLMFCVKLKDEDMTMDNLTDLNYLLHKTDKQTIAWQLDTTTLQQKLDKSRSALAKAKDEESKKNIQKGIDRNQANLDGAIKLFDEMNVKNVGSLIGFLIGDISNVFSRFNETRLHLFTYYQLTQVDLDTKGIYDQLELDLARISRVQNVRYQLDLVDVRNNGLCMKTFQNIHIASSVEGGAMMTFRSVSEKKAESFFDNFHKASFSKRYVWIYLMVLMQRYTLLHLIRELTQVDDDELKVTADKLREKVEYLSSVKVNTYFTDVSDYTQHNQFYRFCSRNLHIPEHFKEIDEKMSILTSVIRHKEQKDGERRDKRFALILAILTVLSASGEVSDLCYHFNWVRAVSLCVIFIIVYCIWKGYRFRKTKK